MRAAASLLAAALLLLPAAVATTASAGCATSGRNATVPTREVRHNVTLAGTNRTYLLWLPAAYEPATPAPVILSFHGIGETPTQQADLDNLATAFFNRGEVVVYPAAVAWNGEDEVIWDGPPGVDNDDVGFVLDVLAELEAGLCIDTSRVYATGKSEGGGFAGTLACNASSAARFAAFAPVSGAFYIDGENCTDPWTVAIPCSPGRCNVPMLEFHGGEDPLAYIDGGTRRKACLPAIPHWVAAWAERDGLPGNATDRWNLTSSAEVFEYGNHSAGGASMVTWVYDGDYVGHEWPATIKNEDTSYDGNFPATFNASTVIIEWFHNWTLPDTDGCS